MARQVLRWYSGSGINRHTWLIDTGPVYIEQWGTGVTTPQIAAQSCHRRSLHARAQFADAIRILHAADRGPRPDGRSGAVDRFRRGDSRRWGPSLRAAHRRAPTKTLVAVSPTLYSVHQTLATAIKMWTP